MSEQTVLIMNSLRRYRQLIAETITLHEAIVARMRELRELSGCLAAEATQPYEAAIVELGEALRLADEAITENDPASRN